MSLDKSLFPLNMVKSELDGSLLQIVGLLEAIDENRQDLSKIEQCIEGFEQLKGVFQMINMPECTLLTESLIAVSRYSIDVEDGEGRYDILSQISSAIVILSHYLEYVETRQACLPALIFTSINELRNIIGEKTITESYFFSLDVSQFDLSMIENIIDMDPSSSRLRQMYQLGLLGVFSDENITSNFKMMERALMRFNTIYSEEGLSHIFRILQGALNSFIEGGVTLNTERKLFFGRIDRFIKILLNSQEALFNEEAMRLLIKDSLYIVALSNLSSDLLVGISDEYSLGDFNLDDAYINRERELMSGPSSSVVYAVSTALREEIAILKDQLDILSRAGDKNKELKNLSGEFKKIEYTLNMLDLNECSDKLKHLVAELDEAKEGDNLQKPLQDFADVLIYIEHSISHLEQRNKPLGRVSEVSSQGLELNEVHTCAVKESRKIIAGVQYSLSTFAENDFNESFLDKAVESLHSAWGGMYFMNIGRAADQIQQSANFIQEKILGHEKVEDIQKLHTLADVLASIDYYLEGLENKTPLMQGALDIADAGLLELGYGLAQEA